MPKRKLDKKQSLELATKRHEEWLASMGYKGGKSLRGKHGRRVGIYDIPNLRQGLGTMPPTSDKIAGNGNKKQRQQYSGHEISGIVLNHKQNYEPVRKDNPDSAKAAAQMRRN